MGRLQFADRGGALTTLNTMVEHELERDLLDGYLADLDAEFGSVPSEMIDEFANQWPS